MKLTRQYQIQYKRAGGKFATLSPNVHSTLYQRPEVQEAVDLIRNSTTIVGVAVQLNDELFNVVSFTQEAIAANSFTF